VVPNFLAHPSGLALMIAAVTAFGTSVRSVFRYPHVWRYLELRQRSKAGRLTAPVPFSEREPSSPRTSMQDCAMKDSHVPCHDAHANGWTSCAPRTQPRIEDAVA
jgi:hypothetical protein